MFKSIADKQPLFAQWRAYTFETEHILSPDGSTRHLIWQKVRAELLSPTDESNAATRLKTIEYLEVQCSAALRKMHDPRLALRDKLTSKDGARCVSNMAPAHSDLIGCHATNDSLAEGVFGTYDMVLRNCLGISMEAASGVAQAMRSMMLSLGDHVAHRKSSTQVREEAFVGWMYSLPAEEQEALVEVARVTVKEMRDGDRGDHANLDEYHKSRRKTNEEEALDALFTQYALALSFFERWVKRGINKASDIAVGLRGFGGIGEREQVYACICITVCLSSRLNHMPICTCSGQTELVERANRDARHWS